MRRKHDDTGCACTVSQLEELLRVRFHECRVRHRANTQNGTGRIDGSQLPTPAGMVEDLALVLWLSF
jgi:hypothetical protein